MNGDGIATAAAAIPLQYRLIGADQDYGRDASGNRHIAQGTYERRVRGTIALFALHEVYFQVALP